MSLPDLLDAFPRTPALSWAPFHVGHLRVMRVHSQNMATISRAVPVERMMETQAAYGLAYTAMLHGTPAAVFGSVRIWQGVEEMWMLCEERARQHPVAMTKAARMMAMHRVISGNLHRLQITVRCDDARALQWGRAIGFEPEAVLRRYGPDMMDYQVMARI